MVKTATAVQLLNNVLAQNLVAGGNDTNPLAFVYAGSKIIHYYSVYPGSYKTHYNHTEGIDGKCRAADDCSGNGYGCADVKMQVFVYYLGQDIQTSGGSIDMEQYGLGCAEQKNETAQIQPYVSHNRCSVCNQFRCR